MAISTYAELQTAVENWVERTDLTDRIPEFIALAEAEFNRTIWTPECEASTVLSTTAETDLPADFRAVRQIYLDTDPKVVPEQVSLAELRWLHSAASTGQPAHFAIQSGDTLVWGPSPDSTYSAPLVYYQKIPTLSDAATTNWLLTAHPDIYLYATLLQAEGYLINDERIPLWQSKLGMAMGQLEQAGIRKAYGGGPKRIRAPQVV